MPDRQDVRAPSDADARRDAAATALLTVPPALPDVVDPIFAAIEKAHALHAVERAAHAVAVDLPDDAPEWEPHNAAYRAWLDHVDSVLLKIIPTTASGCGALARFTVDFCIEEGIALSFANEAGEVDNFVPLCLIAQSPALTAPSGLAPSQSNDIELLRLGEAWADAFEAEQASYARQEAIAERAPEFGADGRGIDEAWRSTSGLQAEEEAGRQLSFAAERIAAKIAGSQATTLAGMQVKARLVQHYAGLQVDSVNGLTEGIARDLLAVGTPTEGEPSSSDPLRDVDLATLGQRFDAAHAVWLSTVEPSREAQRRVAAFEARANGAGMSASEAHRAARLQEGVEEAFRREEEACEALDPITTAILGAPALSLADLAVKARCATFLIWPNGDYEDRRLTGDDTVEPHCARDLIRSCISLALREAVGGQPGDGSIEANVRDETGMALYEDAGGTLRRRPIADWIAFMAQRLYRIAEREKTRQFNEKCDHLDEAASDALFARLQRDLRIDALKALALRPNEVFEAEEAKRREGETPPPEVQPEVAVDTPSLSALTIGQLANLYERHVQVADLWNDALHAPWANDPEGAGLRGPNAAGHVVEIEQERAAELRDAVAAELAGRAPEGDHWARDAQLEAMIRHEMMCSGSLRHAPELRAAISEQWGASA